MTSKDLKKLVEYWRNSSDDDFEAAQDIATKTRRYLQALFFLHLSLEKALKALVVSTTQNHAPLSHNLTFLAQKANLELSRVQVRLLAEINEFNIGTRYPDDQNKIYKKATASYTKKLLLQAKELKKWIYTKLNN